MKMTTIHLVFGRSFSRILLLLLFSGHLLLNKHNSCLAIRYVQQQDDLDWESLLDQNVRYHIPVNEGPHTNQLNPDVQIPSNADKKSLSSNNWNDDTEAEVDSFSARTARLQSNDDLDNNERSKRRNDTLFLAIVGTCSLVGVLGLVAAAIFWYKIQKRAEAALEAEYPSYGVTGPGNGSKVSPSSTMSDRKLAQSAQMFHYQQQRQQMMAQEKVNLDTKPVHSEDSDDDVPTGGDYTVYECPGLAPTGEMEVRNPLFTEPDSSLTSTAFTSHPATNNHYPQPSTSPPKEKSLS